MNRKETSVVFTGDIGFDRYMNGKWNDDEFLSADILDFFKSADHVVANMEGAIADPTDLNVPPEKAFFLHYMSTEAVRFTRKIGTTFWNINNNHIMDAEDDGLFSTLAIAKKEGVIPFGAGENREKASDPVYIDAAGGIGMISVGYQAPLPEGCIAASDTAAGCFSLDDLDLIEERIKQIKSRCRWCVVTAHGGDEFCNIPLPYIRERYHKILGFGADIIVGSHPHVAQCYERIGKGIVFYSLGNFIFDTDYQRVQHNTDRGVLLRIDFTEEGFSFDAIGTRLDRTVERIGRGEVPAIFTEINDEEYKKLLALNACVRLKAERMRKIIQDKAYEAFTEDQWDEHFESFHGSSYVRHYYLDLKYMKELARGMSEKLYEDAIPQVRDYILNQL